MLSSVSQLNLRKQKMSVLPRPFFFLPADLRVLSKYLQIKSEKKGSKDFRFSDPTYAAPASSSGGGWECDAAVRGYLLISMDELTRLPAGATGVK